MGQILLLRELLVLFCGNELSSGLVFAGWLLWTAAGSRLATANRKRMQNDLRFLAGGLVILAFLLPSTLLFIRASRILWGIPPGELIRFPLMLAIVSTSTGPFCLISGAVFALVWSFQTEAADRGGLRPIAVYAGEAIGAAAGGLAFYFFLLPRAAALTSASIVSASLLAGGLAIQSTRRGTGGLQRIIAIALGTLVLLAPAFAFSGRVETMSRRWQWGTNLTAVRDTPFHNLTLSNKDGQFSLFANGLWLFSYPDLQTAEYAAHLALLEHAAPHSVLLISGGAAGVVSEILKHPQVEKVDYVEADPEIIRLAQEYLPDAATSSFRDNRVRVHLTDAASFVRCATRRYDVILLNVGDPMTAEVSRFYTIEFFNHIRAILNENGVFSFSVSSSPDAPGPSQVSLLKALRATLRSVFPSVLIIPGESARFLAGNRTDPLTVEADILTRRIDQRNLDLHYVRDYYLFDYMNPMRIEYLAKLLSQDPISRLNRDFDPVCSFHNLIIWGTQIHPLLGGILQRMASISPTFLWAGLGTVFCLTAIAFKLMKAGKKAAVGLNVMAVGGIMMSVELILLLGFQVLRGYVYKELALIVALFMTGTAMGAGASILRPAVSRPLASLSLVQCSLSLFLVCIRELLVFFQTHPLDCHEEGFGPALLFPILALIAGFLGGLHFSFAVATLSGDARTRPGIGAVLYAWDLAGAAVATVAASLFLIPVFGVETTLWVLSVLCLAFMPFLTQR